MMRTGNIVLAALLATLAFALQPFKAAAAGSADAAAIQYHFAGAADLAGNTNFDRAKKMLGLPAATRFQDLVLNRWAGVFGHDLQLDAGGNSTVLLRPLLNDLLQAESMASFGGRDKARMDFVLAARLDAKSAAAWQKTLETALHGQGEPLTAEGFSGRRWSRPGSHALWILRARDWTVAGRGEDLSLVRAEYLQHIKLDNRPAPAVKENWFSAQVDWPLLANWVPVSAGPLKLARTMVDVTAGGGRMHATAHVSYPTAVPWQPQPWRIPKGLVNGPLSSFTAARNLAAYMNPNQTFSRLSSDPLNNQLFCWAMAQMALESYAACPVSGATNTMLMLGAEAPKIFNPVLEARNHSQLAWVPKEDKLSWTHMQLTAPTLEAAHDPSGDFLLAKVFPMASQHNPPPNQLWSQVEGRNDLVYYDWEVTGLRLMQWRLLTELLPVFPPPTAAETARRQKAGTNTKALALTENWLAELAPFLATTVTEATRKSPTELTVLRNSEFGFTGLELVLLSHWLADAPVGPIDYSLLPVAKMSGPGLPPPR